MMFQAQKVKLQKYVKYTCSMETVQQNGRFTLFSSGHSNIYSIFFVFECEAKVQENMIKKSLSFKLLYKQKW